MKQQCILVGINCTNASWTASIVYPMCIVKASRGQWYKVHYLCFPALCGCMYPGWMKRKTKRSVVTARGEGLRNEKSSRAGPVLPHTWKHTHAQKHTHTHIPPPPPNHHPPIPCHLLAYLKVTCRRRWMCGLQPLKCPHEAKELFVSLEELQSPGWDWNGRLTPLSCFHHNRTTLCHRWEGTQLPYEIHSVHGGKKRKGTAAWWQLQLAGPRPKKLPLKTERTGWVSLEREFGFQTLCMNYKNEALLNTAANICHNGSHSLFKLGTGRTEIWL